MYSDRENIPPESYHQESTHESDENKTIEKELDLKNNLPLITEIKKSGTGRASNPKVYSRIQQLNQTEASNETPHGHSKSANSNSDSTKLHFLVLVPIVNQKSSNFSPNFLFFQLLFPLGGDWMATIFRRFWKVKKLGFSLKKKGFVWFQGWSTGLGSDFG